LRRGCPGGVDAVGGELHAAQPRFPDGRQHPGLGGQDAEPDRPGLRQGRSHVTEGRGGGGRAGELQKVPTGRAHAPSLVSDRSPGGIVARARALVLYSPRSTSRSLGGIVYVRFWGTRGSIAAPGDRTARYGGNTSCTEVRGADGT